MVSTSHNSTARAILYAFIANFGIAIAKTWAAMFTGSGSMLAEAIHSYADTGNQVLLYLGLTQAQKPPDDEHPLGYGKLSYFWSFVVAIILFSLGGLFSIYEGLHKLQHPEELRNLWVAIVVLGLAILLEGGSLFGALREIRKLRRDRPFLEWLKHTRNSELVVVLGEDVGAQLGLILALMFLLLAGATGNPMYDGANASPARSELVPSEVENASLARSEPQASKVKKTGAFQIPGGGDQLLRPEVSGRE